MVIKGIHVLLCDYVYFLKKCCWIVFPSLCMQHSKLTQLQHWPLVVKCLELLQNIYHTEQYLTGTKHLPATSIVSIMHDFPTTIDCITNSLLRNYLKIFNMFSCLIFMNVLSFVENLYTCIGTSCIKSIIPLSKHKHRLRHLQRSWFDFSDLKQEFLMVDFLYGKLVKIHFQCIFQMFIRIRITSKWCTQPFLMFSVKSYVHTKNPPKT